MNKKDLLMASIFLVLALGLTVTPAQPVETQRAVVLGEVEGAYFTTMPAGLPEGWEPPPAYGWISVDAQDDPDMATMQLSEVTLTDPAIQLEVTLVSLDFVEIVEVVDSEIVEVYVDLSGYWDVDAGGSLYEGIPGYFYAHLMCARAGIWKIDIGIESGTESMWTYIEGSLVATPEEGMQQLIDLVSSMNLQQGIENSLDAKLTNALAALEAANAGLREDAVKKLNAFINEVEAQRENKLTNEQADQLIAAVQAIISLIG